MSLIRKWHVLCDWCNSDFWESDQKLKKDVMIEMKQMGWTYKGCENYCPECSKRGK